MKKNLHPFLITLLLTCCWSLAQAYELATHGRMTYEAFKRSVLSPNINDPNDQQFLKKTLGIDNGANPLGKIYYDIFGTTVSERTWQLFEQDKDRMPQSVEPLSVEGWLMRGAIREDDYARAFGIWVAPNPQEDSDSPQAFWRVMNHFYDPVNDRALTLSAVQASVFSLAIRDGTDFHTAPNWATGAQDAFAASPVPEDNRRNHFTVFDAREAMYRALTGKNKNGNDVAPTKDDRNKYWATLFRALGDIVHLVQDMGQPQHTRNDIHSPVPGFGHKSVYEQYIDCRGTGGRVEAIDRYQDYYIDACSPLTYDGYTTPRFTRYSDFFSTRDGTGRGLADYSNRNFFTFGTNLGSNNYPSPLNDRNRYTEDRIDGLVFLRGDVADTQAGDTANIRITTESAFDSFLDTLPTYSLNKYNYDDQARLLIPRAVAYSAGLIDYFFRGRIEAEEVTFVDEVVTLKVKNAIDEEKFPDYAGENMYNGGMLVVTREYKVGEEKRLDASDAVLLEEDILPGKVSERSYTFIFPAVLPQGVTSIKFRLVYRGKLGQEADAVAVGVIEPRSGFVVTPNYVPADGLGGARQIYKYANRWMLSDEAGLAAGNIDWKGWYVNGKPTKTLTWHGPMARYFPNWGTSINDNDVFLNFSNKIYQNGEIFALTPHPVLGAALTKDPDGIEWLIAICKDDYADVVYRRPNKKSDSTSVYDPVSNPEGWQQIGRFLNDDLNLVPQNRWGADRPWFFNGAGTEAQTMRRGYKTLGPQIQRWLFRLKITIGGTASISNEDNTLVQNPWTETKSCQSNGTSDPDSVCVGSCGGVRNSSGAHEEKYSTASMGTGEMVIAVDYRDNEPILAKYSLRNGNTSFFSEVTSGSSSTVCGRDTSGGVSYCTSSSDNHSATQYTRTSEDNFNYVETISAPGMMDVTYRSTVGTRRTVYVSRTETIGGQTSGSQSVDAYSDVVETEGGIQYMDIRNGVVSMYTGVYTEQGLGSVDPALFRFGAILPEVVTVQAKQTLHDGTNTMVVYQNLPDSKNINLDVYNLDSTSFRPRNMSCGSTENYDVTMQESITAVKYNQGYWAVDGADSLFASIYAKGNDLELKWIGSPFNYVTYSYLTDGSPGQVIPIAPENARYSDIGVIH